MASYPHKDRRIELGSAARAYAGAALKTLAQIMSNDEASDSARVAAAKEILDRGYGRAAQTHALQAEGDVRVVIRHLVDASRVNGKDLPRGVNVSAPLVIEAKAEAGDG